MQILKTLTQLHQENPSAMLKQWLQKNGDSKMVQLYKGIATEKWKTDFQASLFFYQEVNHPNYRQLKMMLKEKLFLLIPYIPLSKQDLDCSELKNARNAFIKIVMAQKTIMYQELSEEVDIFLA